jgi:hypothetical protein
MIPKALHPSGPVVDEIVVPWLSNIGGREHTGGVMAGAPMEGPDHDRIGHSHDGAFFPPARGQAVIHG